MNKILKTIEENKTTIIIGGVTILVGIIAAQRGTIVFQKNMFNQLASSVDDLGLSEQVLTYMTTTPVHPWI